MQVRFPHRRGDSPGFSREIEGMGKGWGEASVTTRHYSQQFDPTGASSPLTPSNHFRATIFQSARVPRV